MATIRKREGRGLPHQPKQGRKGTAASGEYRSGYDVLIVLVRETVMGPALGGKCV